MFVHYAAYACLVYQFAAFAARRHGYVQSGPVARLGRCGYLEYGVGFGVKNVPFGLVFVVLALVFKTCWSAVVAVGYVL